ncbi:NAD(P)H-binding protein [Actinomycetes bacterium M1A6_2h]
MRVLVTGSTGYIGSRLIPILLDRGHEIVVAMRDPKKKNNFAWGDRVDTTHFDLDDHDSFDSATVGVDAVVYLVHSMDDGDFVTKDREAAERLVRAAEKNSVSRIVYLSGTVPDDATPLSDHIRSRLQVEETFEAGTVDSVALRAAIILGSGSTSFELVRRMSERLPVTPIPTWMKRKVQPIAVADVLTVIAEALDGAARSGSFDIGGTEVLTYPELLTTYAQVAGLRRLQVPIPFLPTALVGRAVAAITRMPKGTVVSLVESLEHDMVVRRGNAAIHVFGIDEPIPLTDALARAITPLDGNGTESGVDPLAAADTDPAWAGGVVTIESGAVKHRPSGLISRVLLGATRN